MIKQYIVKSWMVAKTETISETSFFLPERNNDNKRRLAMEQYFNDAITQ